MVQQDRDPFTPLLRWPRTRTLFHRLMMRDDIRIEVGSLVPMVVLNYRPSMQLWVVGVGTEDRHRTHTRPRIIHLYRLRRLSFTHLHPLRLICTFLDPRRLRGNILCDHSIFRAPLTSSCNTQRELRLLTDRIRDLRANWMGPHLMATATHIRTSAHTRTQIRTLILIQPSFRRARS